MEVEVEVEVLFNLSFTFLLALKVVLFQSFNVL